MTIAKLIGISVLAIPLLAGCTSYGHSERTWEKGEKTWEWETEGSTFIAIKRVEFMVDERSERGALAGNGVSDNFRDIALKAIDKSPELATAIIAAFRPGGQLEGALAELTSTDPELASAILQYMNENPDGQKPTAASTGDP